MPSQQQDDERAAAAADDSRLRQQVAEEEQRQRDEAMQRQRAEAQEERERRKKDREEQERVAAEADKGGAAAAPAKWSRQAHRVGAWASAEHGRRHVPHDLEEGSVRQDDEAGKDRIRDEGLAHGRNKEGERERVEQHQETAAVRVWVRRVRQKNGDQDVVVLDVKPQVSEPSVWWESNLPVE